MNPEEAMRAIHTKWIKDLRSGEYEQTQGTLCHVPKDDEGFEIEDQPRGYCCLGVLAVTNDYDKEPLLVDDMPQVHSFGSKNPAGQYLQTLRNLKIHNILAAANDGGTMPRHDMNNLYRDYKMTHNILDDDGVCFTRHSFDEIADYLEEIQEPFLKTFSHATN